MRMNKPTKIEIATADDVRRYAPAGQGAPDGAVSSGAGAGDSRRPAPNAEAAEDEPSSRSSPVAEVGAAPEPRAESDAPPTPTDELSELRQQVQDLNDKHLRAVAELQNFRRRAAVDRDEAVRYAPSALIRDILPVVDDLERTLAAVGPNEFPALTDGVRLILQNLLRALASHGVQRMECVGRPFDPALHEALLRQPSVDHEAGTVVQECQAGYKYHERVLRPAKVIIAAPPPGSTAPRSTGEQAGPNDGEGPDVRRESRG